MYMDMKKVRKLLRGKKTHRERERVKYYCHAEWPQYALTSCIICSMSSHQKFGPIAAMMVTIIVSSVVHEYLLFTGVWFLLPILSAEFAGTGSEPAIIQHSTDVVFTYSNCCMWNRKHLFFSWHSVYKHFLYKLTFTLFAKCKLT